MLSLTPGPGLITGGASGMGAAVCELLQREGCRVASLDPHTGGPADLEIVCDVSDDAALDGAYARVVAELGTPRYVFAGAGVSGMVPFLELDAAEWDRVVDVNLRSVYRTVWVTGPRHGRRRDPRLHRREQLVGRSRRRHRLRALQRGQDRPSASWCASPRASSRRTASASTASRPGSPSPA